MTIEKVEIVSSVFYIIDGISWSEDEIRAVTLSDIEEKLRANKETNLKIEEAKAELEQSTECEHTDFFGSSYTTRLYHHKYCPDCGIKLENLCNHEYGRWETKNTSEILGNDVKGALCQTANDFCPKCGEKL
jgi:NADH pyrophosphatase NudC (nudix superfamily)